MLGSLQHIDAQKYSSAFYIGALSTIANRGPKENTVVSEVKFIKPITKTIGCTFDLNINRPFYWGIEFFYDEFDFGYKATQRPINSGLSISSGAEGALDRIGIYKIGLRINYSFSVLEKVTLHCRLVPSLGYYPYSSTLSDTAEINSQYRNPRYEVQYIRNAPTQDEGLLLLLKGSTEIQYLFYKKLGASFSISYQRGFNSFLYDTTLIVRPYEPNGSKQHNYWTTLNGSSFQFHIGFFFKF